MRGLKTVGIHLLMVAAKGLQRLFQWLIERVILLLRKAAGGGPALTAADIDRNYRLAIAELGRAERQQRDWDRRNGQGHEAAGLAVENIAREQRGAGVVPAPGQSPAPRKSKRKEEAEEEKRRVYARRKRAAAEPPTPGII